MKKTFNLLLIMTICNVFFSCKNVHNLEETNHNTKKILKMKNNNYSEYKAIEKALQSYLVSPNTAKASGLKNDWYEHLSVVGEINGHSVKMSRDEFIELIESHEPTLETKGKIVKIDLEKNAACAKLEFITPGGFRFTDYILMYKEEGVWKASSKVFDTNIHYNEQTQENTYTEYEAIEKILQNYFDAAKRGKGENLNINWLERTTIVGEYGENIIKISRDDFAQAISHQGVAPTIGTQIITIDYNGKAAYAKISINDWLGTNYTDYLVLHKQGNKWLVAGKVYDVN